MCPYGEWEAVEARQFVAEPVRFRGEYLEAAVKGETVVMRASELGEARIDHSVPLTSDADGNATSPKGSQSISQERMSTLILATQLEERGH